MAIFPEEEIIYDGIATELWGKWLFDGFTGGRGKIMVIIALLLFPVMVIYDCMRKNK